jgi:hypothetical protein
LAIGYGANGMLTGNGENNGLFWRKNGDRDAFIWVWTLTWRKSTQNPVFEDNFLFLILWKSQRQRLNTHIVRDLGSRILLLVKFNRLVFSFVNFVVSLQAEIS